MLKKIFFRQFALLSIVCLFSGCVYLIVGGVGALGGYVVSPDTVEGISKSSLDEIWNTATNVVGMMGVIDEQSKESGIILSRVNGTKVTITISTINQNNTKLNVKARKAFLPKITVAQDVFVKIMSNVNE